MVTTKSELFHLPLTEVAALLESKEVSPVELMKTYLSRIEALDGKIGAIAKLEDGLIEAAKRAEGEIMAGDYRGPLHGTTFTVKDQLDAKGNPSFVHGPSAPKFDFDATPIAKMKEAGAIYMGKAVMAMQPDKPQPRNPWNLEYSSGGSSSGSGAGLSAGFFTSSLGEDSAGSIRFPASYGNQVGTTGSYGRVSRHGLAPLGWTKDHCGPMTHGVKDSALIMQVISGHDPLDYTSSKAPVDDYVTGIGEGVQGMIVGVPASYIKASAIDPEVLAAFGASIDTLVSLGAEIEEFEVPDLDLANACSLIMHSTENSAAQYDHMTEHMERAKTDRQKYRFLALSAFTTGPDYLQAQRFRQFLRNEFKNVTDRVDVIATPTHTKTAPLYATPSNLLEIWLKPTFCAMYSVTGMPAMSVPGGFNSTGMPIGLQLAAAPFNEATMLKAAYAYEQATPWHERRAAI
jgi:aspartyl-tRNA(Asn)/glutamyl-tRNA(Gln) amidotransferase subunit A